ncbi:sensor histidine kinase [Okibacterium endophyticum]
MNIRTAWNVAVAAASLVVTGVILVNSGFGTTQWGAIGAIGIFCVVYYVFGRRLIPDTIGGETGASAGHTIVVQTAFIVIGGIGAALEPNMLTMQVVVFPFIWVTSASVRRAIAACVGASVVFCIGYIVSLGADPEVVVQGLVIEGVSLAFSVALGLWITSIAEWGEERQRLLDTLQQAQGELELLHRDAGATAERERLAREIHDTIAQNLTSVVMLAQRASLGQSVDHRSLELIETTAREALTEARALVASNSALPGGTTPLSDALARLGERFERETGVRVSVVATPDAIPRELEVVLLRCAQEGLANVRKHADAQTLALSVSRTEASVQLRVRDDGRGLGGYRLGDGGGFGLTGMRDRVSLVGGTLSVRSPSAGATGTELTVAIPLDPSSAPPPHALQSPAAERSASRAESSGANPEHSEKSPDNGVNA